MAKRGGKAASRKSRQRRAQRGPAPRPVSMPSFEESAAVAASGASTSAFDRADAEVRAMASTTEGPARPRTQRRAPAVPYGATGPSRLSDQAIAEYHYVLRDLRNIGVLVVILVVLLLAATLVVNAAGIGPG
ncbi:MAG TPA: hypothetical protein VFH63_05600 [candidate division Zixibacteria bacterium]|nr:hypothetical protein [candidate division Zixibacteria bacterium]